MIDLSAEELKKIHILALKIGEVLRHQDQLTSDLAMIEAFVLPWSKFVDGTKEDAKVHGEWFCEALMSCLNFTMEKRHNMVSGVKDFN